MNYSPLNYDTAKYRHEEMMQRAAAERLIHELEAKPRLNYRLRVWLSEQLITWGTRLQVEAEIMQWRNATPISVDDGIIPTR